MVNLPNATDGCHDNCPLPTQMLPSACSVPHCRLPLQRNTFLCPPGCWSPTGRTFHTANLLVLSGPPASPPPPVGDYLTQPHIMALRTELFRREREEEEEIHSILTFLKNSEVTVTHDRFVHECVLSLYLICGEHGSLLHPVRAHIPSSKLKGIRLMLLILFRSVLLWPAWVWAAYYLLGLLTFPGWNYYSGNCCSFFYSVS